ncbi:MAG: hypothetical protein K2N38_04395 [Oscillospiraceae bacterium]|nr:hypothetical protein [Oscillospiraceae bacterium]
MTEKVFSEILAESFARESARFDNVPEHKFSLRHRIAMKRIFARFDGNVRKLNGGNFSPPRSERPRRGFSRRIVIALLIIVLMTFLAGFTWMVTSLYSWNTDTPEGYTVDTSAIAKLRRQLAKEGIDADSRVPTHEITDEQMEWLAERHDLGFLSVCGQTHEDYGKFLLDLAYLNVFSLDELENMFGVTPFNDKHLAIVYNPGDPVDGSGAGYVFGDKDTLTWDEYMIEIAKEYLREKEPGHTEEEYTQMAREFNEQSRERMEVLEDFFERAAEKYPNQTEIKKVTEVGN